MKTLNLVLIACLLAFFTNCQENFINEPGASQIEKHNLPAVNTIKICCEVRDPAYGICNLNGCVDYVFKVINETMNPRNITMVSVKLQMNSTLCDKLGMVHLEWRAVGSSSDVVYVSEEGIVLLEKSYPITNRSDVVLLATYLVTTNGIGIARTQIVPLEKEIQFNNYKEN